MDRARGYGTWMQIGPVPSFVVGQVDGVAYAQSGDEYLYFQTCKILLFAGNHSLSE
ncbi:MAG: hypothetical protein ACOX4L_04425 [Bacillota bacterium]|jgi:hypothetical protein